MKGWIEVENIKLFRVLVSFLDKHDARHRNNETIVVAAYDLFEATKIAESYFKDKIDLKAWAVNTLGKLDLVTDELKQKIKEASE